MDSGGEHIKAFAERYAEEVRSVDDDAKRDATDIERIHKLIACLTSRMSILISSTSKVHQYLFGDARLSDSPKNPEDTRPGLVGELLLNLECLTNQVGILEEVVQSIERNLPPRDAPDTECPPDQFEGG